VVGALAFGAGDTRQFAAATVRATREDGADGALDPEGRLQRDKEESQRIRDSLNKRVASAALANDPLARLLVQEARAKAESAAAGTFGISAAGGLSATAVTSSSALMRHSGFGSRMFMLGADGKAQGRINPAGGSAVHQSATAAASGGLSSGTVAQSVASLGLGLNSLKAARAGQGGGRRRTQAGDDPSAAVLTISLAGGIGVAGAAADGPAGSHVSGSGALAMAGPASESDIAVARSAVCRGLLQLLRPELPDAVKARLLQERAERRAQRQRKAADLASSSAKPAEASDSDESSGADDNADTEKPVREKDEEEEEDEDDEALLAEISAATKSPFSALCEGMKQRFVRDSEELLPEDTLRYLYTTAIVVGVYRLSEAQRIRQDTEARTRRVQALTKDKLRMRTDALAAIATTATVAVNSNDHLLNSMRAARPAAAAAGAEATRATSASLGTASGAELAAISEAEVMALADASEAPVRCMSPEPLLPLLDRWSLTRIGSLVDSWTTGRQWDALYIAALHIKELLLAVHALLEVGDDEGKDLGEQLLEQFVSERETIDLVPRLLKTWEPGRYAPDFVAVLAEAAHYTLKCAEKAAALGVKANEEDRKDATKDDDNVDFDVGKKAQRGKAGDKKSKKEDRPFFEAERYTTEFAHPTIIRAYKAALDRYDQNGAKLNYFLTGLLIRIDGLPNDYAGMDKSGKPLTYRPMLYNVALLDLGTRIILDPIASGTRDLRPLYDWAMSFCHTFIKDMAVNRMLPLEALFWRADKTSNAEISRHYGLIDGHVLREDAEGNILPSTEVAAEAGTGAQHGKKRKSKAALEADAAEAEAARNRAYRDEDDDEAQVDFDLNDLGDVRKAKNKKKDRRGNYSSEESSSSESESETSSSGSDSDAGASVPATASARPSRGTARHDLDGAPPLDSRRSLRTQGPGASLWSPEADIAIAEAFPAYMSLAAVAGDQDLAVFLLSRHPALQLVPKTQLISRARELRVPLSTLADGPGSASPLALLYTKQLRIHAAAVAASAATATIDPAQTAPENDGDNAHEDAETVLEWIKSLLLRAANARANSEAVAKARAEALVFADESSASFADPLGILAGAENLNASPASVRNISLFPASVRQSEWFEVPAVQRLLLECGAVPSTSAAGSLWWCIPGSVPSTVIRAAASGISMEAPPKPDGVVDGDNEEMNGASDAEDLLPTQAPRMGAVESEGLLAPAAGGKRRFRAVGTESDPDEDGPSGAVEPQASKRPRFVRASSALADDEDAADGPNTAIDPAATQRFGSFPSGGEDGAGAITQPLGDQQTQAIDGGTMVAAAVLMPLRRAKVVVDDEE
jgi:hypothetical protein